MKKENAYARAENLLDKLLENQPNLLMDTAGNARAYGAKVADFCHDFIDQYAKRLMDRKDPE